MPDFAVLLGNSDQPQICINGMPWDNQSGSHEASIAENATNQNHSLSCSIHRGREGIHLKFLRHVIGLEMHMFSVGMTQFDHVSDKFRWNTL
jgi:hypothetical protein